MIAAGRAPGAQAQGHLQRSLPGGPLQLHSASWPRAGRSWFRQALKPSAAAADSNSLRARLRSLRRAPTDAYSSDEGPGPEGLQQLRSSSENLRVLLERRAQRRAASMPPPPPPAAPLDHLPPPPPPQSAGSAALVPLAPPEAPAPLRPAPGGELEAAPSGGRRMMRVRFWLKYRAEWGQRIKVVGTTESLGAWTLPTAPELKWSEGDMWHTTVEIPAGSVVEYKYVLLDHSGQHAVAWQRGNNSVLAVRHSDEFVEVFDNWGGDPGAKVVADGGPPTTREGRLLSWAGEIEAQVSTQRAELRRARMELVSAQEDAKLARQDAMRLRAQLAQQEADRLVAVARARQLEVANQVLSAQLEDVTRSFRQALETASDLLQHTDEVIGAAEAATGASAPPPLPPPTAAKARPASPGSRAAPPSIKARDGEAGGKAGTAAPPSPSPRVVRSSVNGRGAAPPGAAAVPGPAAPNGKASSRFAGLREGAGEPPAAAGGANGAPGPSGPSPARINGAAPAGKPL